MPYLDALTEIIGVETIGGMVTEMAEDMATGFPAVALFEEFGQELDRGEDAQGNDIVVWDREINTRDMPAMGTPDAPSIRTKGPASGQRFEAMAHVAIHDVIPLKALMRTRATGELRANAARQIEKRVRKLVDKALRAKNFFAARIMTPAGVVMNSTNFPDSDISYTLQAPEIATNAIVSAQSIADPTTRFFSGTYQGSLHSIADALNNNAAYEPGCVIGRRKFSTALRGLDEINELVAGSALVAQQLRTGPLGAAFNGIGNVENWMLWEQFFHTLSGSVNPTKTPAKYLPEEDDIIALPPLEALSNVLGWARGSVIVPEEALGFGGEIAEMGGEVEGLAVYAYIPDPDPVSLKIVCRASFFYFPLQPGAVQYVSGVCSGVIT